MTISQVGNGAAPSVADLSAKSAPAVAGTSPAPAETQRQKEVAASAEQVQQAMKQVAEAVQAKASNLEFSVDKETGTTVVKVVDAQTKEVIRQIPPEEMLSLARAMTQAEGLLVRQKA